MDEKKTNNLQLVSHLLEAAILQDSLLQSYRSLHVTLQSVFIAISTGLTVTILSMSAQGNLVITLILQSSITVVGIIALVQFRKVILARGRDVNYWHRLIIKTERNLKSEERILMNFKIHQKLRREDSDYLYQVLDGKAEINEGLVEELVSKGLSHTRKIIDKWFGRGLLFIWFILLSASIFSVLDKLVL